MMLRCDPAKAVPEYVYYFFKSHTGRHQLLKNASQVGTPGIGQPLSSLKSIEICLPGLRDQRAVAHVLSTFDDKIELNRRMNETLEAIARAVFKSWFVDFDPVRAKASGEPLDTICRRFGLTPDLLVLFPGRLVDSELGEIPEGWACKRVDDLLELAYGKALRASDRKQGPVPVYGSGGIAGFHDTSLVDGPGIIVGRKGTVGSLYWEDRPFFPIDTVFYVVPKVELAFCFYVLQTLGLDRMNTDAAVPGLNRNNVYRLPVLWPPESLRRQFDSVARLLRGRFFAGEQETRTLASIRDMLLPKLLSGELRFPFEGAA
jgi:type I restriction enzyme S subunit